MTLGDAAEPLVHIRDFRMDFGETTLGRFRVTSIAAVNVHRSSGRRRNERQHDHRQDLRRGGPSSPARGRVNGGRHEGVQFAYTEPSDAAVTLSPAAQPMRSIAATATSR